MTLYVQLCIRKSISLSDLTEQGEDARAAMLLYRLKREEWERDLASLSKTKRCKTSRSRSTKPQQKQHEELEEG
jgi:hypothetical protein